MLEPVEVSRPVNCLETKEDEGEELPGGGVYAEDDLEEGTWAESGAGAGLSRTQEQESGVWSTSRN